MLMLQHGIPANALGTHPPPPCALPSAAAGGGCRRRHPRHTPSGDSLSSSPQRCSSSMLRCSKEVSGPGGGAGSVLRATLERLFANAEVEEPTVSEPSTSASAGIKVRWPSIDWSRYNLQLLFVDRSGSVRSRLAAGIFERIAEWNGWSRSLVPWSCGLHTSGPSPGGGGGGEDGEEDGVEGGAEMSKRAAVFTAGSSLGLFTGSLVKPADKFDLQDLDYYDLVLVVDSELYQEILSLVAVQHLEYYKKKVCLLTCFSDYESEGTVLATGGLALLPRRLSGLLRPGFEASKKVVDILSPNLSSESSEEELGAMVRTLILACGGLCKYLMDSFPETEGEGPHTY